MDWDTLSDVNGKFITSLSPASCSLSLREFSIEKSLCFFVKLKFIFW